jgi:hypothetical protein
MCGWKMIHAEAEYKQISDPDEDSISADKVIVRIAESVVVES